MTSQPTVFKRTLIVAGVLLAVSDGLQLLSNHPKFSQDARTPLFQVTGVLSLISVFALLLALFQIQMSRQSRAEGAGHGWVPAACAASGVLLLAGVNWSVAFLDPAAAHVVPAFLDHTPPASLVIGYFGSVAWFGLSWMIYAISLLRGATYPRGPIILLLGGSIVASVPFLPFQSVFVAAALVWLAVRPVAHEAGAVSAARSQPAHTS